MPRKNDPERDAFEAWTRGAGDWLRDLHPVRMGKNYRNIDATQMFAAWKAGREFERQTQTCRNGCSGHGPFVKLSCGCVQDMHGMKAVIGYLTGCRNHNKEVQIVDEMVLKQAVGGYQPVKSATPPKAPPRNP